MQDSIPETEIQTTDTQNIRKSKIIKDKYIYNVNEMITTSTTYSDQVEDNISKLQISSLYNTQNNTNTTTILQKYHAEMQEKALKMNISELKKYLFKLFMQIEKQEEQNRIIIRYAFMNIISILLFFFFYFTYYFYY